MIYKKCIMTIAKNGATLDEDIYLYRLDKNIELHFTIVNNKYKFDKSDLNNIIAQTNAAYFQVRLYKNADIKYTFAIQPTQDGVAILTITDDLIDDPIEVGEYDFQISLLDEDKTSMISMPIVSKQLHVCEPLVSEDATMGKAVLGLSKLAKGEIKNAFDSEGNYIREIHQDGEIISASTFNKFEEALETNTKAIKNGTGGGGTGTSYDDTQIKNDIKTLKDSQINLVEDETSMEGIKDNEYPTLTTTDKTLIGSINEVNAQYKDIAKQINKFHLKIYSEDGVEHTLTISDNNELLLDGNKISQNTEKLEDLLENRILVWHDEFNENSLNNQNWNIQVEGDDETHRNNEVQAYLKNNVSIDTINKNLVITAKKETYTGKSNISGQGVQTKTYNWTSGSINTNNKMEFLYGRLEMRAKLPCVAGTWPAFWLLNHLFPNGFYDKSWAVGGEIDIFEQYNTKQEVTVNLWQPTGNGCSSLGAASYSCNPAEWHIYAFEWTENKMEVFVDGNSYKTYDTSNITCDYNGETYYPYKMAQQIKLNMALGSTAGSCSDDTNGAEYRIDWIRLYAPENYQNEISPTTITLNETNINITSLDDKKYLMPTVSPIEATNQTIIWQSSNNNIATVSDGCITPIKNGNCTINAICNTKIANCNITVNIDETSYDPTDSIIYQILGKDYDENTMTIAPKIGTTVLNLSRATHVSNIKEYTGVSNNYLDTGINCKSQNNYPTDNTNNNYKNYKLPMDLDSLVDYKRSDNWTIEVVISNLINSKPIPSGKSPENIFYLVSDTSWKGFYFKYIGDGQYQATPDGGGESIGFHPENFNVLALSCNTNGSCKFYINGIKEYSFNLPNDCNSISYLGDTAAYFYEARTYNKTLSDTIILNNYNKYVAEYTNS